jgi:hypothetical protein
MIASPASMHRRSNRPRALSILAAPVAITLLAAACSGDEPECEKNEDCEEVTCPDGTKKQSCSGGECFANEDCENQTGGGW